MSFLDSSASSSSLSHVPIQIDSDTHETGNRICMKMSILAVRARWTSATHPCARLRHTSLSEGAASWIKVHTLAPHGGVDPESTFERSPAREKIRHRVHGSGGLSPATSNSGCVQFPRAVQPSGALNAVNLISELCTRSNTVETPYPRFRFCTGSIALEDPECRGVGQSLSSLRPLAPDLMALAWIRRSTQLSSVNPATTPPTSPPDVIDTLDRRTTDHSGWTPRPLRYQCGI